MIRSFSDPIAEKIFLGQRLTRKEEKSIGGLRIEKAQERLAILNQASERDLLNLLALHYHRLHGKRRYSIDADSQNRNGGSPSLGRMKN